MRPVLSVQPGCSFFFFNDTATTEIYTLSLHDALPIFVVEHLRDEDLVGLAPAGLALGTREPVPLATFAAHPRSEEHTSELQSPCNLVCRLLLEKKKRDSSPQLADYRHHTNRSTLRTLS